MFPALALLASACSWVYLAGVALGRPWLLVDSALLLRFLVPAATLGFFALGHAASAEICARGAADGWRLWPTSGLPLDAMTSTTPGGLFGMLLVQNAVQALPSEKPSALLAAPMFGVHALGAAFYLLQA
jgi:hypothetical protein